MIEPSIIRHLRFMKSFIAHEAVQCTIISLKSSE